MLTLADLIGAHHETADVADADPAPANPSPRVVALTPAGLAHVYAGRLQSLVADLSTADRADVADRLRAILAAVEAQSAAVTHG